MAMKLKENAGVDPVTLSRGFTKLDGDPPHSGENILKPEHVEEQKEMDRLAKEYGFPDEQAQDDGHEGFLERDPPVSYQRPNRGRREDLG